MDFTALQGLITSTLRILEGLGSTFSVYSITIVCALPIGLMLSVIKVSSKNKVVNKLIDWYTWILRGTPLMLQLYFFYFGLRGVTFLFGDYMIRPFGFLNDFSSATLAFVLNYAAYFTEIFRGGIQSVDKGQYEAAKALGLTYGQSMRSVIIPQAMRAVLPSIANECITLVKDTALIAALAIPDLLRNSRELVMIKGNLTPFVISGAIYLILASFVIRIFRRIENKYEEKLM